MQSVSFSAILSVDTKILLTQLTDIKIIPIVSADIIERSKWYRKIDQSTFRLHLLKAHREKLDKQLTVFIVHVVNILLSNKIGNYFSNTPLSFRKSRLKIVLRCFSSKVQVSQEYEKIPVKNPT